MGKNTHHHYQCLYSCKISNQICFLPDWLLYENENKDYVFLADYSKNVILPKLIFVVVHKICLCTYNGRVGCNILWVNGNNENEEIIIHEDVIRCLWWDVLRCIRGVSRTTGHGINMCTLLWVERGYFHQ